MGVCVRTSERCCKTSLMPVRLSYVVSVWIHSQAPFVCTLVYNSHKSTLCVVASPIFPQCDDTRRQSVSKNNVHGLTRWLRREAHTCARTCICDWQLGIICQRHTELRSPQSARQRRQCVKFPGWGRSHVRTHTCARTRPHSTLTDAAIDGMEAIFWFFLFSHYHDIFSFS